MIERDQNTKINKQRLIEAPAKYTMGVIMKLAEKVKIAREEELTKQIKSHE